MLLNGQIQYDFNVEKIDGKQVGIFTYKGSSETKKVRKFYKQAAKEVLKHKDGLEEIIVKAEDAKTTEALNNMLNPPGSEDPRVYRQYTLDPNGKMCISLISCYAPVAYAGKAIADYFGIKPGSDAGNLFGLGAMCAFFVSSILGFYAWVKYEDKATERLEKYFGALAKFRVEPLKSEKSGT
jgi:hypothetical protein